MSKIKISEIKFKDGKVYHRDNEVDYSDKAIHQIFDFEDDDIKYVQLKIHDYDRTVRSYHLHKYIIVKSLAKLLEAEVVEDWSIRDEAKDNFWVTMCDGIRDIVGLEVKLFNPYKMDFDHEKLKEEDDGSHTYNGMVCIEPNNRTSNYFRDFLMLHNADHKVLIVDDGRCDYLDKLMEEYPDHHNKILDIEINDIEAYDIIETMTNAFGCKDIDEVVNAFLVYKYAEGDKEAVFKKVQDSMNREDLTTSKYSYDNLYYEIVEAKAKKLKEPRLLFNELIQSDNHSDIQYGLKRIGFNLVN